MKKIVLPFIVITLAAIIYQTLIIRKQDISLNKLIEINDDYKNKIEILENNISYHWKTENGILTDSTITDEKDIPILKETLFNTTPVLVFRFSELNCSSCIQEQTILLNDIVQSRGMNYIIVSDYDNIRNLGIFKRVNGINVPIYNCKKLLTEETVTPFYFILNENGSISDLFYPDKIFPDLSRKYIEIIQKKYFTASIKK